MMLNIRMTTCKTENLMPAGTEWMKDSMNWGTSLYDACTYMHVFSVLHMLHTMSVDNHHLDLVPQPTPRCHSDETWDQ